MHDHTRTLHFRVFSLHLSTVLCSTLDNPFVFKMFYVTKVERISTEDLVSSLGLSLCFIIPDQT